MRLTRVLSSLPRTDRPAWQEYGILLLLVVAAFLACWKPLSDPDSYWHLALGRQIWQSHALVRSETFSFTDAGAPWEDTEWLFHAVAFPLWKAFGDLGLQAVTALLGALGIAFAYRPVRLMGGDAATMAVFLTPTLWAYADRVRFRPDAVSVLFAGVLCELLIRWRRRPGGAGPEGWAIALLFLLWVQIHGAWTYGMLLLGAFVAGWLLDAKRERSLTPSLLSGLLFPSAASVAVLFLNPYGWRLPLFPLRALASFSDPAFLRIAEWSRTPISGLYGTFTAAVLVTLLAVLLVRRRFTWSEFLPVACQVALGLYWVRYAAFATVALAGPASSRLAPLGKRAPLKRALGAAGALCAAGLLLAQAPKLGRSYDLSERYPVHEAAFLSTHLPGGNLLHEFRVGGYLEWALPGGFKVFMDGRFPLFRAAENDFYQAHRTPESFRAFLGRYPFDAVIYAYPGFRLGPAGGGPERGPSSVLFPEREWALVGCGPYGMVLLRREAKNDAVIAEFGYGALRPDDLPYVLWAANRGEISRTVLQGDIRRSLRDPLPPGLAEALQALNKQLEAQERGAHAP